jgi:hypothetical protein
MPPLFSHNMHNIHALTTVRVEASSGHNEAETQNDHAEIGHSPSAWESPRMTTEILLGHWARNAAIGKAKPVEN